MRIQIFGKADCAGCKETQREIFSFIEQENLGEQVDVIYFDLDTPDGLAEAAFNDVMAVPVTIIEADDGQQIARFDGVVPDDEALDRLLPRQLASN